MGILYVCNEKIQKNYMIEAIFNKVYTINNVGPYVKYISVNSTKNYGINNNVFLLLDKIRKIIAFK